ITRGGVVCDRVLGPPSSFSGVESIDGSLSLAPNQKRATLFLHFSSQCPASIAKCFEIPAV
ncbi:unnamed protein product, partial [Pylaiella littoralis]